MRAIFIYLFLTSLSFAQIPLFNDFNKPDLIEVKANLNLFKSFRKNLHKDVKPEEFQVDALINIKRGVSGIIKYDDSFKEMNDICQENKKYCYGFIQLGNAIEDNDWQNKFFKKAQESLPDSKFVNEKVSHLIRTD